MATESADPTPPAVAAPDDTIAQSAPAPTLRNPWPARILLLGIGVVMWGVDQLVKAIVVDHLVPGEPVAVVGRLLQFSLVRNSGAAFSLGESYTVVFTVIASVAAVFVLVVLLPRTRHPGWAVALGLLLGGILGNLTDRLFRPPGPLHGHVVDFIQLRYFATFNVADMCVTTAAVMIVVLAVVINVSLGGERQRDKQPTSR